MTTSDSRFYVTPASSKMESIMLSKLDLRILLTVLWAVGMLTMAGLLLINSTG